MTRKAGTLKILRTPKMLRDAEDAEDADADGDTADADSDEDAEDA
ncbi:MAG: hypothetical protein J07HN4v3_01789 [Halonotius sp. J07HN4]|nr:MAG: hypothetical protein J07HN4v3_01789 [Halonotius sp. J07HN4]